MNTKLILQEHLLPRMKHLLVFPLLSVGVVSAMAQQTVAVKGKVTDRATSEGIPGVTVLVKGTSVAAPTDPAGNFALPAVDGNGTLVISSVGFQAQEIAIGNRTTINVQLGPDAKALDEVVVVGYGTQVERNVTGAVQQVKGKELQDLPVAQITQKLQGKLAGVQILQTTGQPGGGMTVRIRGQASLSAGSDPLYVVDGFPIVGDIRNINPNEVESISILKDAASTSLYGSRAANGVVLVTTKQAAPGETSLGVHAYYGVQQVPQKGRPDIMNGTEFAQFQQEVFQAQNLPVPAEYQNPAQYGKGTDWYDVLLQTASIQDYSISLASNKDKFRVSAVAGFFKQDGVLLNSSYKRFSLRLNSEFKPTDKLLLGFNAAPVYVVNSLPSTDDNLFGGGIIQTAITTSPLAPYKNPDGTIPLTASGPGLFPNPNPYRVLQDVKTSDNRPRLLSNAFGQYEFFKGLSLRSSINVDIGNNTFTRFSPSTAGRIFAPPPQKAVGTVSNGSYYSWLNENLLNYKKTFGKHNLDVLAGYTVQQYYEDFSTITKTDFPDDKVQTLNAGATTSSSSSSINEWALLSYLSRVTYDFKGRYLFTASIRRDGSSRFGQNNKWGNFPAVSAGWVVSDEEFMSALTPITFLKIRSSYGVIGNNNIGNYGFYARVNPSNYVFNGTLASGKNVASLSNPNLGWERTKAFDIGLDMSFLKNRISFVYDYYRKNTDGLLYSIQVPLASGFDQVTINAGQIKFWGHEFSVTSRNFVDKFVWNTNVNVSYNDNKVIQLGPANAPIGGGQDDVVITRVGERVGQFYGYVFDGIYETQVEFDNSPKHASSALGTVKYVDLNGDGIINVNDRTIIGNPVPKFLFGLTNDFRYANFDLSIVASGSYGNDIMNRTLEYTQNLDGVFNVTKDVARRWKSVDDPGDGIHPRVVVGTPLARTPNSRWVSDGSYLTIKNITLGYGIPMGEKKYFKSARVYGSVQQAFVFTNYDGANPEVSNSGGNPLSQGIDFTAYPVPRTFTFGVDFGL